MPDRTMIATEALYMLLGEVGVLAMQSRATPIYISPCVVAFDVSTEAAPGYYEVVTWPHHEVGEEDDCAHLVAALERIGPWAPFAVPLETFEEDSGVITYLIANVMARAI